MRESWLADTHPSQAWEHQAWTDFATLAREDRCVLLPCPALGVDGPDACLDLHEQRLSPLLSQALALLGSFFPHLVLPPLRQLPVFTRENLLRTDFDTGHGLLLALAKGVHEAGLRRLVFVHASPLCAPLLATAAIDARAEFGLDTYVLDLSHPEFVDAATGSPKPESIAEALLELRAHRRPQSTDLVQPPPLSLAALPLDPNPFPAYRERYLGSFSLNGLKEFLSCGRAEIILPIASIEQHAHHLPVGVDSILGQAFLHGLSQELPAHVPLLIAPPITFGKSNEHKGFPGTLSLSAPLLHRLLWSQLSQLAALGFRKIHLLNTHGGNTALLRSLLQEWELKAPGATRISFLQSPFRPSLPPQEAAWGMHADEWETSLMLACAPHLVHMERATREYPADIDSPARLKPEKAGLTFAWLSSDVSRSGVMGDALAASLAKGREWLAVESRQLALKLLEGFPKA